jgi:HEAT repeat protein
VTVLTNPRQSFLRSKGLWWIACALALPIFLLTVFVTGVHFNLGSRNFTCAVQSVTANGPIEEHSVFVHTGWDGPTGSFTSCDTYGITFGRYFVRLDIVDDPIAAARRRLPATLDGLVTALDSKDRWLRSCALERLAELGASAAPAIPSLIKLFGQGNEEVADTLLNVSKSAPERAAPLLAQLLNNRDAVVRWRAAELLGEVGPPANAAIPALAGALQDREPRVIAQSAIALRRIDGRAKEAVPALTNLLSSSVSEIRAMAAVSLGEFGLDASAAESQLVRLLDDSSAEVRAMAVRTLSLLRESASSASLQGTNGTRNANLDTISKLEALTRNEDMTAHWAIDALATMGPDAAAPLAEIYSTAEGHRRLQSAHALMKLGRHASSALPLLVSDIQGTNVARVYQSAQIVGHLGASGRAAIPQLMALLDHDDARVRVRAAEAIWHLEGGTNVVMPVLLAALQDESIYRGSVRRFAIEAITNIGPAAVDAVPFLQAMLSD